MLLLHSIFGGVDRYPSWWVVPAAALQAPEWREGLWPLRKPEESAPPGGQALSLQQRARSPRRLTHALTS